MTPMEVFKAMGEEDRKALAQLKKEEEERINATRSPSNHVTVDLRKLLAQVTPGL